MEETKVQAKSYENEIVLPVKQRVWYEEEVVSTMEYESPSYRQTRNNYARLISNYEATHQKLRKQLSKLKNNTDECSSRRLENPKQNKEAMNKLAEVQHLLEVRNKAFLAYRLEAALWWKSTSISQIEFTTRSVKQGMIKLHRPGLVNKKIMWVEIYISPGKETKTHYEVGYVMLTYADSKNTGTFNRWQITHVANSNSKKAIFTVRALSEGTEKELTFGFETELQRDDWLKSIMTALAEVRDNFNSQKDNYTLKLEFAKKKVGVLIEQRSLTQLGEDVSIKKKSDIFEGTTELLDHDIEKENKKTIKWENKVEQEEQPCEMFVIEIVDKDLKDSGLKLDSIVSAINETVLVGKVCSEQRRLLTETPKPFVLTFSGRNFRKTTTPKWSYREHEYKCILKKLVALGDNDVKKSFNVIVKGTEFERELKSSKDRSKTVTALLNNQRRLLDLLQNYTAHSAWKQQEQEFKE